MGGGAGRGLNFGATFGSGMLPLGHQTNLQPRHREVFPGCTTRLNEDAQGKHIPGHRNYQRGKSHLTISMSDAQLLADKYGGTGKRKGNQTREVVDFGETIGMYIDRATGRALPTRYGSIHYGKRGCHIVPANPEQY